MGIEVKIVLFSTLSPMLATMRPDAFDDPEWIFEPKWDGWRLLIHKQGDRIEAYTRHGTNVTPRFPELQEAVRYIRAESAILDCEGICLRDGRSVFDDFAYRGRLQDGRKIFSAAKSHPATFVVFDVIYSNGHEHTHEPLLERKERLADIVEPTGVITPTMYVQGAGVILKKETEERNWEGIVAKRANSRYVFGRSPDWLKVKNWKTIDTVILGYRKKPQFGLIVGAHFPTVHNKPIAVVEFGFRPEEKAAFLAIAKDLHTVKDKDCQWIEPVLCCRVQYLERTERHNLRIVSFRGFLPNKNPEDCVWAS
jgi:bifunctional non-homologous end joining protein LigD